MTTYKQGQEWQRERNENMFLKLKVQELQDENEELRLEILQMRATADQELETLDEIIDAIPDDETWHEIQLPH